jgi:hypothetical protein
MEDAARGSTSEGKYPRWLMWALAIIVSVDASVRTLSDWHAYDLLTRFDTVVFVLLLVAFPVRLVLSFRKSKPLEIEQIVVFTYILLLMSTILAKH